MLRRRISLAAEPTKSGVGKQNKNKWSKGKPKVNNMDQATYGTFSASNSALIVLFATPASVLVGYGIARCTSAAFNELRTAVFSKGELRKQQKKNAEENLHKVVLVATEIAETAASEGKAFCITRVYTEYNKIT